ncbi:MAG TPA: hypothetical protein VF701_16425 [Thermoanaerobaculia bacterium]
MKNLLIVLSLLGAAISMTAQPKSIEAVVQQINDRRTSGSFAQLLIAVQLPGVPSSQVVASRVLVTAAVDDTGASLLDAESGEPALEPNSRGSMFDEGEKETPVTVALTLKNPSRKATKVKEVRGEVELFMPAKDPNSVAEVAKFLSFSGKSVDHKALKSNGVEILLLSKADIESERKKIAEAHRKEYKEAGYEDGEDLENTIASMMEYTLIVEESDVPVRIKDPHKRIQEIEYVDSAGEVQRVHARNLHEDIGAITTWGDPPGADWKLRVKMKTSRNLERHAFVIRDVELP